MYRHVNSQIQQRIARDCTDKGPIEDEKPLFTLEELARLVRKRPGIHKKNFKLPSHLK